MKVIGLKLFVMGLAFALPLAVPAQSGSGDNFDYTVNPGATNTITVTLYTGSDANVTIPTTINNLTVTTVGNGSKSVFSDSLASVIIPDSVTTVGNNTFFSCIFLASATLGNGVSQIGDQAFWSCWELTNVTFGASVTSIGDDAFGLCYTLTSLTIPASVTTIGVGAFYNCLSLTNIAIPANVTNIGYGPFAGCSGLTAITVDPNNPDYCSANGVLFNKSGTALVQYPAGNSAAFYAVPSGVTNIGPYAFDSCSSLFTASIGANVASIGDYAFASCLNASFYFVGNAPTLGVSVFFEDGSPGIYFLPATTGWPAFSANTGLQAILWNPAIQTAGGSFGVISNNFGFNITGATNYMVVVRASPNLANPIWIALATNRLTNGSSYFADPQWINYPNRYYDLEFP
jgi:hypothetical protein